MGLLDAMQSIAQDTVDNQPQTVYGTITQYYNGTVTVNTDNGTFENIKCSGIPKIGSACMLVPVGDEYNCIPDEFDDTAMIYALGLGKFSINSDGDLIVDLGIGVSNYFSITSNGDLTVNLDSETNQKFKINENGDVIYGEL